jgi:hypothetical protein
MLEYMIRDKRKYKIGLDVHGVITTYPKVFSRLTKKLIRTGHEIHIVTGAKITDKLVKKLLDFGIEWTTMFSIIGYHESIGTKIQYDENGPWIDKDLWNRAKGKYAMKAKLNIHIDDSDCYGKYFTKTMYLMLTNNVINQ